jgi:5-methylcytosine-specific restriction protein A
VDVGPVTPETARRLACDAKVSRIITDGGSQPLDVGRSSKVIPPALRRAVIVRDGGCRFPGCGRPPSWCDAHHILHWADGGRTALDNLLLLCRPHHRAVHGGFRVRMVDGAPVFERAEEGVAGALASGP